MKKALILVLLVSSIAAGAFANGSRETVTVEGKLALTDSVPTIVSGGKTWALPAGLFYRAAFEFGIKAGDTLKIEGTTGDCDPRMAEELPEGTAMLMPSKVWVNGKAIDVSTISTGPGRAGMGGMAGRMSGGMRGQGSDRMQGRGRAR